jgi:hypothetical protein
MPGKIPLRLPVDRGNGPASSGGCAQMQLRGHYLGATAALETRENADAGGEPGAKKAEKTQCYLPPLRSADPRSKFQ